MSIVISESKVMPKLVQLKELIVYGLVFLFPIAGIGVRHWFSTIFCAPVPDLTLGPG